MSILLQFNATLYFVDQMQFFFSFRIYSCKVFSHVFRNLQVRQKNANAQQENNRLKCNYTMYLQTDLLAISEYLLRMVA